MALKNLAFGKESQPRKTTNGTSVSSRSSASSSDVEHQAVPQGVTIKVTQRGNQRVPASPDGVIATPDGDANGESSGNGVSNSDGKPQASTSAKEPEEEERGVEMEIEELLAQRA